MTLMNRAAYLTILALGGCAASPTPEPLPAGDQVGPREPAADAGPSLAPGDGAPVTPPEEEAEGCDMTGTWQGALPGGHFRGEAVTWEIAAEGATQSAFGTARVRSTTTLDGGEISIVDHEATPAMVACEPDPPGRYAAAFGEGCATVTLTLAADSCSGRRDSISGLTLTRR